MECSAAPMMMEVIWIMRSSHRDAKPRLATIEGAMSSLSHAEKVTVCHDDDGTS